MTLVLAIASMNVLAQKVTFVSEEFEAGVKAHLGIGDADEVMQAQTDAITAIDLSGLEIVDISDVLSLPNLTWIDLGYNKIEDVSPLASLEHLHYVNLRRNELETINPLVFACTDSLHVNVAENYIKDYSYFFGPTSCQFIIEGMRAQQQEKNAPYLNVYQLYAYLDEKGEFEACYRGFTNVDGGISLVCGSQSEPAKMDGYTNSVTLPEDLIGATKVILSNGETSEETYVVPIADNLVEAGKTVTLTTGLPDDYYFSYAVANVGTVKIVDNTLQYTAPEVVSPDVINFCYYKGSVLKGFSRFYINWEKKGDVNGDNKVDDADAVDIVNHTLGKPTTTGLFNKKTADVNDDKSVNIADVVNILNMF